MEILLTLRVYSQENNRAEVLNLIKHFTKNMKKG